MNKGEKVFHVERSELGIGEVLELTADRARVRFDDPVSSKSTMGWFTIGMLRPSIISTTGPPKKRKLVLRSKNAAWEQKGQRIRCSDCGVYRSGLWKFAATSWGEVLLCMKCKARALDYSFGKKDALDGAASGGRWGENG